MRLLFAWITSLLITTSAACEVQTVHIQNGNAQGSGVLCGGTSDNSHRVILSVAHVTGTTPGSTMIATVNGRRYRAWLIGADQASDSALLVVLGRHLEDIPSARLWLGDISNTQETVTEGYSGQRFVRTLGKPAAVVNGGRQLEWTAASYPGMSGGPTYLSGSNPPAFLTTTTGSDFRSFSIGPYRTWFYNWVPTLKTTNYRFVCGSAGTIQMRPRGIEGPIAVPQAPPEATAESKPSEPTPAEPSTAELKQVLQAELEKLLTQPKIESKANTQPQSVLSVIEEQPAVQNGEIITINVPVRLRVRSEDRIRVEVVK